MCDIENRKGRVWNYDDYRNGLVPPEEDEDISVDASLWNETTHDTRKNSKIFIYFLGPTVWIERIQGLIRANGQKIEEHSMLVIYNFIIIYV